MNGVFFCRQLIMTEKELFDILWESYLLEDLTEKDYARLMQLIDSGRYDAYIKTYMVGDKNVPLYPTDSVQSEAIYQKILAQLNQHKISPIVSFWKNKWLFRVAAFIGIVFCSIFYFNKKEQKYVEDKTSVAPTTRQLTSNVAVNVVIYKDLPYVKLPDGTLIYLQKGASITFDTASFKNRRFVDLKGEAYFDVFHDNSKPFVVTTGEIQTTVLGTAFNINALGKSVQVTVTRGKVRVSESHKVLADLIPNQQVNIDNSTGKSFALHVNAANTIAWTKKYFILDDVTMAEASKRIAAKYGVQIQLDKSISSEHIQSSFLNNENLKQVLDVICATIDTKWHITEDKKIIIEK